MRFYLQRETDYIYLDQLFKAAAILDDYRDIRRVIESGWVRVNDDITKHRRQMLHAGDIVRFREHHIRIMPNKSRPSREPEPETPEHIVHGQGPQRWVEKPIVLKRRKRDE